MKRVDRDWLLRELEVELGRYGEVKKEVVYSSVMDTGRRFRADYCVGGVFVEVNGGQWGRGVVCDVCGAAVHEVIGGRRRRVYSQGGRHTRVGGYEDDLVKMNLAQMHGFIVLQYTYEMLGRGDYKEDLRRVFDGLHTKKGLCEG